MIEFRSKLVYSVIAATAMACLIATPAVARHGGSFGSRGARTYNAPSQTSMTPRYVAPLQRSMTQPPANGSAATGSPWRSQAAIAPSNPQARPGGLFSGFGGGMIGGLITGGLIGSMMGHGGGWGMGSGGMGGGFLITLIQLLGFGAAAWFVVGWFRRKSKPAYDTGGAQNVSPLSNAQFGQQSIGNTVNAPSQTMVDMILTDADKADFERLLLEVQDAFGHEDYGRLRAVTTPEIMSYLSEELSQNATSGRRNDVSGTKLIEAEVSEAWREENGEYATIAMRYTSIDCMRDRATNAVVEGDPLAATETTEIWTFVRPIGGAWRLSAIQE